MRIWVGVLVALGLFSIGCSSDDRLIMRYISNKESVKVKFEPAGEKVPIEGYPEYKEIRYRLKAGEELKLRVYNVGLRGVPYSLSISYECVDQHRRGIFAEDGCDTEDYMILDRHIFYSNEEINIITNKALPAGYRISFLVTDRSFSPYSASGFYITIE